MRYAHINQWEWPKRRFATAPATRDLTLRNTEKSDECSERCINHSDATGSEATLKYVQANGVRFAYLEQGSGPLVMFMHGFPDNAWSYRKQMQVFADAGYRAVAPFLRGYAPTEIRRMEFSIPSRWARTSKH